MSDKGAGEFEELPDWLKEAGLQFEKLPEPPEPEGELIEPEAEDIDEGKVIAGAFILDEDDELLSGEIEIPGQEPDWLSMLGEGEEDGEAIEGDTLLTEPETGGPSEAPSEETTLTPRWSDLSADEPPTPDTGDEIPDWLSSIGDLPDSEKPAEAVEEQEAAGEIPDWLRAVESEQEVESETQSEQEDEGLPDWLRQAEPPPELGIAEKIEELTEEGPPEWLATADEVPESIEEVADETYDEWIAEHGDEIAEEVGLLEAPEEIAGRDEIPDWFAQLEEEETRPEQPAETEASADFTPDWFAEEETEEGIPDWLREITEEPTAPPPPPIEEEPETPAEAPDWLAELDLGAEITAEPAPSVAPSTEEPEPGEMPDWLAEVVGTHEPEPDKVAEQAESVPPLVETPSEGDEWLAEIEPVTDEAALEGEADWLKVIEQRLGTGDDIFIAPDEVATIDESAAPVPSEPASLSLPGDEDLDWLAPDETLEALEEALTEVGEPPPTEKDEEVAGPAIKAEVPEWVRSLRPTGEELIGAPPDWLWNLSPGAVGLPLEEEAKEETSGPLKGLRGVLPAEPITAMPGAPELTFVPTITDTQTRMARQIEKMAVSIIAAGEEEEIEGGKSVRPRRATPLPFMRVIITVIVLALIALPFYLPAFRPVPLPKPNEQVRAVHDLIDQIPSDGTVLLSFDYDPAASGEMNVLAEVLLTHLIERHALLLTTSIDPMGAMIGKYLVEQMATRAGYEPESDFADISYIAGGASGLRNLAHRGKNTPLASLRDGRIHVDTLDDLHLIIILADSIDDTRLWMEQVRPATDTPIALVTGAGIEPVARPYLDRVQGYMAGYRDAMAYTTISGGTQSETLELRWHSMNVGAVIAAVMIALGNLGYLIIGLVRSRRQT